ncbi:MAG: hypothetical protein BroJett040_18680 [Oligoflexia bacterium]|nr:MAG: hypothetical protein BroJett040_18680 [Oligoflexia bacterium]
MDTQITPTQNFTPNLPTNLNSASVKQNNQTQAPNLGDYMDYRKFLSDWYDHRRAKSKNDLRPYSYAMFSAAADIKSPNYLKMIIDGKRNLSTDMISKFGKALGFSKAQTEELLLLVLFTQATDPAERNIHLKQLTENRVEQKLQSGEINQKAWDKIPNWIAWVLYAMLDQEGVEFHPDQLRSLLRGKATADEIDEALKSLIRSGEITQDDITGKLKKANNMETPEDVPVALVRKLQSELMYLGLESLFQDAPTEREFGSLTLTLTRQEFEELRFKLRQMRKAVHKDNSIKRMTTRGERVYQMNLQLFPVTNAVSKEEL